MITYFGLSSISTSLALEFLGVGTGIGKGASTLCFFLFFDDEGSSPKELNLFFRVDLKDSKVGFIAVIPNARNQFSNT